MSSLGLDIGSLYVKAVIMNDGDLIASAVRDTTGNVADEIDGIIAGMLSEAALSWSDLECIGVTGRGADAYPVADLRMNDVSCIGAAVQRFLPETNTFLDIGGQSITSVLLDEGGSIIDFMRNDKCASGSGKFLSVMSGALGVSIDRLDEVASHSRKEVAISSQCGVFVESEIITHINEGEEAADILAGLCESVAKILISQAIKFGSRDGYTFTGGVAMLDAVTSRAIPRITGAYLPFPIDPRLAAATGAALLARTG
jgi:(R)-2-hydroxyacyl-CoA dehydratese activating ATPase